MRKRTKQQTSSFKASEMTNFFARQEFWAEKCGSDPRSILESWPLPLTVYCHEGHLQTRSITTLVSKVTSHELNTTKITQNKREIQPDHNYHNQITGI